ncbi:MAG: hypothetical protein ACI35O_09870 [Bacillaceae bacterium]
MDGVTFYFFMWFWLIIFIFLVDRKWHWRKKGIVFLFLLIISSTFTIPFLDVSIRGTYYLLLIGCFYFLALIRKEGKSRVLILSFCIGLLYGAFQMMKIYDPVYFFYRPLLMISCLLVGIGMFIGRGYSIQLIIIILGVLHGELLLGLVLHRYGLYNEIVSFPVLDCLALTWTLLSSIHLIIYNVQLIKKRGMRKERMQ